MKHRDDATGAIDGRLAVSERDELGHIAYLIDQLHSLRQRGLFPDATCEVVVAEYAARRSAIEHRARYEAGLAEARRLWDLGRGDGARAAAKLVARLDPLRIEGWVLAINYHARAGQYDEAIDLASEGAVTVPSLADRLNELMRHRAVHDQAQRLEGERRVASQSATERLARLKEASASGNDHQVVALGAVLLAANPDDIVVLALLARAYERLDRGDEALRLDRRLWSLQPDNLGWKLRLTGLESRPVPRPTVDLGPRTEGIVFLDWSDVVHPPVPGPPPPPELPQARLSWRAVAGEFLLEHWQKLILCLAVLLIVVSSTVGAHHLLGEKLVWSRAGQCLLALMYTATFAAFGTWLVRWGAGRAGRIMLLTTLLVVPVNFSLAGELRLLSLPTAAHLAIFAMDAAVLITLCIVVVRSLGLEGGTHFAFAFFTLGAFDATAARGVSFEVGLFALFASAWVFLGSVFGFVRRLEKGEPTEDRRDSAYFALGLLAYAYLFFAYRSGVFVLQLIPRMPWLMAVPAMLSGMGCVRIAHTLPRLDKEPRRILVLQMIGLAFAGLAFALAWASPPSRGPLLSANELLISVLGLILFAAMLRAYRKPFSLYFAAGALAAVYFAGYHVLRAPIDHLLVTVAQALGYRSRLPLAFVALNALGFNLVLVAVEGMIRHRWDDPRLARHCGYIGLPLSIAACVFSTLEPTAAALCLLAYAALYALATAYYSRPLLIYPACLAFTGAAAAAASLLPDLVMSQWALAAGAIGLGFWTISWILSSGVHDAYRRPLLHATVTMAGLTLVTALVIVPSQPIRFDSLAAIIVASALFGLATQGLKTRTLAYVSVAGFTLSALLLAVYLGRTPITSLPATRWGLLFGAAAATLALLSAIVKLIRGRRGVDQGGSTVLACYEWPLVHVGLIQVILALTACVTQLGDQIGILDPGGLAAMAVSLLMNGVAMAIVTQVAYRRVVSAAVALAFGCAAYAVAVLCGLTWYAALPLVSAMAVAIGLLAAALATVAPRVNFRSEGFAIYGNPCRFGAFAVVIVTWGLVAYSWESDLAAACALALATVALSFATRRDLVGIVAHWAIASALGTWLCLIQIATGRGVTTPALYALVLVAFALLLLGLAEAIRGTRSTSRQVFERALPDFARLAALVAVFLVILGLSNGPFAVATLWAAAVVLVWSARFRADQAAIYVGLSVAVAGGHCLSAWLSDWNHPGIALGWQAVTAALWALVLCAASICSRGTRVDRRFGQPCVDLIAPLALGSFLLAISARVDALVACPHSVAALLLAAVGLALATIARREARFVYGCITCLVAASYVVVLSVGDTDPEKAWVLGLVAAVEGLALTIFSIVLLRRAPGERSEFFAQPMLISTLLLTVAAIALGFRSPVTMLLVGLVFLLLVEGLPAAGWLYGAVAAFGVATYFKVLSGRPESDWIFAAMIGACALWTVALAAEQGGSWLRRRLKLADVKYERPLYNAALAVALIACGLRFDLGFRFGAPWIEFPALPPALAVLAILMIRPYPHRLWVDIAVLLLTFSAATLAAPRITTWPQWLAVALAVALVWLAVQWVLRHADAPLGERPRFRLRAAYRVVEQWSLIVFALGFLATATVVVTRLTGTSLSPRLGAADSSAAWYSVLLAIFLAAAYIDAASRREGREWLLTLWFGLPPLVAWWFGVSSSPLARVWGLSPQSDLPVATTIAAFVTAAAGWVSDSGKQGRRSWLLGRRTLAGLAWIESASWPSAVVLVGISLMLTEGRADFATVATLGLSVVVLAALTVERRRVAFAAAGSLAWLALGPYLLLAALDQMRIAWNPSWLTASALCGVAAAFALVLTAGWLRRVRDDSPNQALALSTARAWENVALLGSGFAALIAMGLAVPPGRLGPIGVYSGVAVLIGLATILGIRASRRHLEWPVYLAQVAIVTAYGYWRLAYPRTTESDALVLCLLGYVDFALADLLLRYRLDPFGRPTLHGSLVLPVLPLAFAAWRAETDDVALRVLFLTATFYAIACYRLGRKRWGYIAAVLYDAALWVLWAHYGWRLADQPQLFLIPVGVSIILFAEVNRRELGRSYVNSLRNLGLVVIYASLAYPVLQTQSFGAWVTLLLLSLAGVFIGIALRAQSFLWMGLAGFFLDVLYQLGRMGMEHTMAKWAIMLALGITLVMFVAMNEKKRIVDKMRVYYELVRQWE